MAGHPVLGAVRASDEPAEPPIRLMIVDDSAVARAVLARMISESPAFEIVDAVSSAHDAITRLKALDDPVDIILLDIEMPGRSGIAALPELIACSRGARILIVSALAEDGAAATVEALTLGAADTLAKPGAHGFGGRFAEMLRERLHRLGRGGEIVWEPVPIPVRAAPPVLNLRAQEEPLACIAIGASTGGLHAIAALLRALPAALDVPILITQHLPPPFMPYFAEQMAALSGRKVVVARAGMPVLRGQIHVAPGHAHLCVDHHGSRMSIRLRQEPSESGCLPSVDPMFESVAEAFGAHGAGVVLSGMGRDGTKGALALERVGADILVQDAESSVVWGMPGSVSKAGLANAVLPPAEIARLLRRRWERA